MNNLERIVEDFVNNMAEQTYASKEQIKQIIKPVVDKVSTNKDYNPEELIKELLDNVTNTLNSEVKNIMNTGNNLLVPGYTMQITVGGVNVKIYGGNFKNKNKLSSNAIFDLASISKMYTQLVAYYLINNKVFSLDDKISDLDDRFVNLNDLTIRDITTFSAKFQTPERIDDTNNDNIASIKDAKDKLFNTTVIEKGVYNYNDIGMMILKEVMERVTNLSYETLVDKLIIERFKLNETFTKLPDNMKSIFTGSASDDMGVSNDAKAIIMGGVSGHAGIKASSSDLLKFAKMPYYELLNGNNNIPKEYTHDLYTPNPFREDMARGIIGSSKIANPKGLDLSDSPITSSKISNSAYGSTKTQYDAGIYRLSHENVLYGSTVLLNPASISHEQAKRLENEINEKRKKWALENNKTFTPISLIKELNIMDNNTLKTYHQIDSSYIIKFGESTDKLVTINGELTMQLLFIHELVSAYDKNYEINYDNENHTR